MSAVAIPRRIKPHSAASTPARLKTAAWCAIASQVSVVIDLPHSKPPLAASSGARSARPGYGSARLQPNGATGATFAVALLPNPSGAGPTPPPQTAVPAPLRSAARAPRRPRENLYRHPCDQPALLAASPENVDETGACPGRALPGAAASGPPYLGVEPSPLASVP